MTAADKPAWMIVAERELARGVREVPGARHDPRVLKYHAATTLHATSDEVPWCSAFVNWCLVSAAIAGTRSAAARSWLTWGVALEAPRFGAITVLQRGTNPAQGHVGFYVDARSDAVLLLGGNQGNAVSMAAYPRGRVLGFRWPTT